MSPTPEPATGLYLDSCGTRYMATHEKKTGWWLQKQPAFGCAGPATFQKPDFPAAVLAGVFTKSSDTI